MGAFEVTYLLDSDFNSEIENLFEIQNIKLNFYPIQSWILRSSFEQIIAIWSKKGIGEDINPLCCILYGMKEH